MPVVSVPRDLLFETLGRSYSNEEFSQLCFDFGIELDEVTTESNLCRKRGVELADANDEVVCKIEVPANRCDLLCFEGISRALLMYLEKMGLPSYRLSDPMVEMHVNASVMEVRPHIVCAVLRNVRMTQRVYKSFIELQEKLHSSICRKRYFASIGTHDLDTLEGPFSYTAELPEEIRFVPLEKSEELDGHGVMELYRSHAQLKNYLYIIQDKPRYPVVRDRHKTVLSLPPIINGNHSRVTLNTKNILIEVTALDRLKADIVLDIMTTMFSQYCAVPYVVEPVRLVFDSPSSCSGRQVEVSPNWERREIRCRTSEICEMIGVSVSTERVVGCLSRMGLGPCSVSADEIAVGIPPTRPDVIHACDIVEDVAIAYGYNNVGLSVPSTATLGRQLPINELSDSLRRRLAELGYTEILSFVLCSARDQYDKLNQKEDGKTSVRLRNPVGNVQVVRSNLLPGLLNSLSFNKGAPLPVQVFEIGDVVFKNPDSDIGASNKRQLAAIYQNNKTAGFEQIHGLLDSIMLALDVAPKGWRVPKPSQLIYSIHQTEHATFFPRRCAKVQVNGRDVGIFGIIHPEVLENFRLQNPSSALLLDLDIFL
ncbi:phenylalanine--tRNA ligase beta subunit-like [Schistocerca gregaria]|uniref:phenylalanine--tRNA ligase beta subunit-like n=1 Tax=Schistocerca gregaria TaxID=7010 RepID=UPI00211DA6AB|nr:phenylalanine--tRNA ligase beta subunit-like [Schistocerca gregaria]